MTAVLAQAKAVRLSDAAKPAPQLRLSSNTCFGVVFTTSQFLKVPNQYRNFFPSLAFEVVHIKQSDSGISILARPLFDQSGLSLFRWESEAIKSLIWQAYNLDESTLGPLWDLEAKPDRYLLSLIENCPFDLE